MKTMFKKIKKNCKVTYQYEGLFFTSKYIGRQKHSKNGEWIYIFKNDDGSTSPIFAKDVQVVFYCAE